MTTEAERLVPNGWTFDGMGTEFDNHVARHLPGYADVQRLVALIGSFVLHDGGTYADIGASTGLTAANLVAALPGRSLDIHLYDSDATMLTTAHDRFKTRVSYHYATLPTDPLQHSGADLTTCLWLLQFLHPNQRRPLLGQLRRASSDDGVILIATKARHADPRWEEMAVAALDDYKAGTGVTPEERVMKTSALRGIMHTLDLPKLSEDLGAAGWHSPAVIWRWHFWAVVGAWASPIQEEM